jgi:hypothetical protein
MNDAVKADAYGWIISVNSAMPWHYPVTISTLCHKHLKKYALGPALGLIVLTDSVLYKS